MVYAINYDLHGKEADYIRLYRLLHKLKAKPVMDSYWLVDWSDSAKKLGKVLLKCVNADDDLVVTQLVPSNVGGQLDRKRWLALPFRKP